MAHFHCPVDHHVLESCQDHSSVLDCLPAGGPRGCPVQLFVPGLSTTVEDLAGATAEAEATVSTTLDGAASTCVEGPAHACVEPEAADTATAGRPACASVEPKAADTATAEGPAG